MRERKTFLLLLTAFAVIAGMHSCKEDAPEPLSEVPEIEFISIAPNPIAEFSGRVTITIAYTDGDGDLGENTADVDNIFVTDSRNLLEYTFRLKQLAPDNTSIAIQGELDIVLENVSVLESSATQETVTYDVYVVDRAGNKSNVVTSSQLTITR